MTNPLLQHIEEQEKRINDMQTPALRGKEGDEEVCPNCGEDLSLETYDWFDKGYELAKADFGNINRSSLADFACTLKREVEEMKSTESKDTDEKQYAFDKTWNSALNEVLSLLAPITDK